MKKRTPKYVKILSGMNHCYGDGERDCSECPYDKYNERDIYGQGTSYCMEKLNEDAKKWAESISFFTTCGDCVCFHRDRDENDEFRFIDEKTTDGFCSIWRTMMSDTEYCSRGAMKDE